jgi:flagellar protein FliJ
MKKSKSTRLELVLELAEREERAAADAVHLLRNKIASEQQRLRELQEYYREYSEHFQSKRVAVRASEIANQRHFLTELTRMQDLQAKQIKQLEENLNLKLAIWRKCHLKYQALKNLIKRIRKSENYQLERKEQKLLDEWFTRMHSHT